MNNRLLPNQVLPRGEKLVSSNGLYTFVMQDDGNLVLYKKGKALWASKTQHISVKECVMQGDGNLVLYRYDGKPVWDSHTNGKPGANLIVQDDGNVVIYYDPNPKAIWATGTNQ